MTTKKKLINHINLKQLNPATQTKNLNVQQDSRNLCLHTIIMQKKSDKNYT